MLIITMAMMPLPVMIPLLLLLLLPQLPLMRSLLLLLLQLLLGCTVALVAIAAAAATVAVAAAFAALPLQVLLLLLLPCRSLLAFTIASTACLHHRIYRLPTFRGQASLEPNRQRELLNAERRARGLAVFRVPLAVITGGSRSTSNSNRRGARLAASVTSPAVATTMATMMRINGEQ